MARRFPLSQSALPVDETRLFGAAGSAAQSSSALFTSLLRSIHVGRMASARVARREPWFYRRLGPGAGLTLFRVLRGGLELGECLGRLRAGRTSISRLPLAPSSRILSAAARELHPHRRLESPAASALTSFSATDPRAHTPPPLIARRLPPSQSA